MQNLQKIILENLRKIIDSDITCLFKFDQNNFNLIDLSKKNEYFQFEDAITKNLPNLDFALIDSRLKKKFSFKSVIISSFQIRNSEYFLYSASKELDFFSKQQITFQSDLLILLEKTLNTIFNQDINKENNSDLFPLFAKFSNELVFTLNNHGIISYINEYGLKQLKFTNHELIGKHFFDLVSEHHKVQVAESLQKIISQKNNVQFKAEIIPKVSVEQLFNFTLIPIFKGAELQQILGIGSNINIQINEKRKNEELSAKLIEAKRINEIERERANQQISVLNELNILKNEFISNVSHELRTPLASIIGFSETITEDKNLTIDRAKEFSNVILVESKRLAKLINDVLDFSELESEKQQLNKNSVDIISILNECLQNYQKECESKNLTLTSRLPDSKIVVYADEERLKKAINYLFSNAIKFTKELGRVTIYAQEFLKEVEIVISDTGIGISEEKIPLLFSKFSKIKNNGNNFPGVGFGLVAIKQIIDLHNGIIRIKSKANKGTSFIIRLPKYSFN